VSDARIGALSGREAELGNQRQLAGRLESGDVGANERREIQRQTGGAGELDLLQRQQAVSREIEQEKAAALEQQQSFAQELLRQEQARLRIAQQIAEIEARSNEARAISTAATARVELSRAQRTGDSNQIAAARSAVSAADQGVALAGNNVDLTSKVGESLEKELAVREKILGVQQNSEKAELNRGSAAAENARRIDLAQTLDKRSGKPGEENAAANELKSTEGAGKFIDDRLSAKRSQIGVGRDAGIGVTDELARNAFVSLDRKEGVDVGPASIGESVQAGAQSGIVAGFREFFGSGSVTDQVRFEPLGGPGNVIDIPSIETPKIETSKMEETLKRIEENTANQSNGPIVNNFNGGNDAIQQYTKLKTAESTGALRDL
jgi:hypothetical protein